MSIEDKDRRAAKEYVEDSGIAMAKCYACDEPWGVTFVQCFLAGISYGRSTPNREVLERFSEFAHDCNCFASRGFTPSQVVDQFLSTLSEQPGINKEK